MLHHEPDVQARLIELQVFDEEIDILRAGERERIGGGAGPAVVGGEGLVEVAVEGGDLPLQEMYAKMDAGPRTEEIGGGEAGGPKLGGNLVTRARNDLR